MIKQLWQEHCVTRFPKECVGQKIESIDLTLLDGSAVGCISTFLKKKGKLDLWRTAILGLCYHDLAIVVRELDGEARDYFQRLEMLSKLVLEAVRNREKSR